ncbi:unnamed protein product, partial [Mesorhabditis spiculigera]
MEFPRLTSPPIPETAEFIDIITVDPCDDNPHYDPNQPSTSTSNMPTNPEYWDIISFEHPEDDAPLLEPKVEVFDPPVSEHDAPLLEPKEEVVDPPVSEHDAPLLEPKEEVVDPPVSEHDAPLLEPKEEVVDPPVSEHDAPLLEPKVEYCDPPVAAPPLKISQPVPSNASGGPPQTSLKMSQPSAPAYQEQPPSYDAMDPADAPPSYDSLYGQFRQVEDPKGLVSFLGGAWHTLTGTVAAMIALAFLNILPIAMILLGALNKDNCPIDPTIPKWLIVSGIVHLVKSAINYYLKLKKIEHPPTSVKAIDGLLSLFSTVWFILGSIWVYSAFGHYTRTPYQGEDYCDPFMLIFSFVFITVTYAILALMCFCFCCCCCCICFKKASDTTTNPA